jgi:dTDP-N-acetylfucosamine:lipid II N-acetylfucosaminyltransferase
MNIHLVMPSVSNFVHPFRNAIQKLSEDENTFYSLGESNIEWIESIRETQILEIAKKADKIFIHGLFIEHIRFILEFNKRGNKIIWIYYGFDADYFVSRQLYSFKTYRLLFERKIIFRSIATYGTYYYTKYKKTIRMFFSRISNNKILDKIDVFAFWFLADYKSIFSKDKNFDKFQFFFYSLINQFNEKSLVHENAGLSGIKEKNSMPSVLLGYSANPINNHIDVLIELKRINFLGQIICPLSYGGSPNYVKKIIEFGHENFGESFKPLISYLPLNEYNDLLLNCDIGIFNSYRQSGGANILQLLENGKTVYLSTKNPLYNYFNTIGCKVFPINKHFENNSNDLKKISTFDSQINKRIIEGIFNSHNFINSIKNLLLK